MSRSRRIVAAETLSSLAASSTSRVPSRLSSSRMEPSRSCLLIDHLARRASARPHGHLAHLVRSNWAVSCKTKQEDCTLAVHPLEDARSGQTMSNNARPRSRHMTFVEDEIATQPECWEAAL